MRNYVKPPAPDKPHKKFISITLEIDGDEHEALIEVTKEGWQGVNPCL